MAKRQASKWLSEIEQRMRKLRGPEPTFHEPNMAKQTKRAPPTDEKIQNMFQQATFLMERARAKREASGALRKELEKGRKLQDLVQQLRDARKRWEELEERLYKGDDNTPPDD